MVSLNQLFAPTANSIQNLVAFSRSIGVFKTCFFICDAKSAVSIKMLNCIISFATSSCILIQLDNVAKPRAPSQHKIYFHQIFPLISRSSVPLSYVPSISPQELFHTAIRFPPSRMHTPFEKSLGFGGALSSHPQLCSHLSVEHPPPPHLLALKRS